LPIQQVRVCVAGRERERDTGREQVKKGGGVVVLEGCRDGDGSLTLGW
jgi:hypothetical protein